MHSTMNRTSIGAVSEATRRAVATYRDEHELPNYDVALRHLLEDAGADDVLEAEA